MLAEEGIDLDVGLHQSQVNGRYASLQRRVQIARSGAATSTGLTVPDPSISMVVAFATSDFRSVFLGFYTQNRNT